MRIRLITLCIAFILAGCASNHPAVSAAPDSSHALVKGNKNSALTELAYPLVGLDINITIEAVDGKKLGGAWNGNPAEVVLSPGRHKIAIVTYFRVGDPSQRFEFDADVEAGHTYKIILPTENGRYTPKLRDISNTNSS